MSSSFRKIDYSLRPAKYAERKMLAEIFRRLWPFSPVEEYIYVGFGSVWFSDFILFHRALGVRVMISFEKAGGAKARIECNKPFDIDVRYKEASAALPGLDWASKHFIWLDYDCRLSTDVLADARIIANNAVSGTVIAVSVQCNFADEYDQYLQDNSISATDRFVTTFGHQRVGQDLDPSHLTSWKFAALSRKMIMSEVADALSTRNSEEIKMEFNVISEIEYSDDAKMTTIVGIFVAPQDAATYEQCHFEGLKFSAAPNSAVRIEIPKLTKREIASIEQQLPLDDLMELELGSIPPADARNFAKMYRYFPNFSVVESL